MAPGRKQPIPPVFVFFYLTDFRGEPRFTKVASLFQLFMIPYRQASQANFVQSLKFTISGDR